MARNGRFGKRSGAGGAPGRGRARDRDNGPEPQLVGAGRTRPPLGRYIAIAIVAAVVAFAGGQLLSAPQARQLVSLAAPEPPLPDARSTTAALPRPSGRVVERQFPVCGSGKRVTCVVDGDTIWLEGVKIRIADINTPEVASPACADEARLAAQATRRLRELLNDGPFELRNEGRDEDRYGRKLRTLHRNGQSLGDTLVAEGLAHPWRGRKESWCG